MRLDTWHVVPVRVIPSLRGSEEPKKTRTLFCSLQLLCKMPRHAFRPCWSVSHRWCGVIRFVPQMMRHEPLTHTCPGHNAWRTQWCLPQPDNVPCPTDDNANCSVVGASAASALRMWCKNAQWVYLGSTHIFRSFCMNV